MKSEDLLESKTNRFMKGLSAVSMAYDKAYIAFPKLTSYSTSLVAVMGGDYFSKQVIEGTGYGAKDAVFTFTASLVYNYLAPKMITWSKQLTKHIKEKANLVATGAMLALYYPVNFAYWNALTIKNDMPITADSMAEGLVFTAAMLLPYIPVDYFAIKKLSSPKTEKYIRPFYAAVELAWNTVFTGGSYVMKNV